MLQVDGVTVYTDVDDFCTSIIKGLSLKKIIAIFCNEELHNVNTHYLHCAIPHYKI